MLHLLYTSRTGGCHKIQNYYLTRVFGQCELLTFSSSNSEVRSLFSYQIGEKRIYQNECQNYYHYDGDEWNVIFLKPNEPISYSFLRFFLFWFFQ